ncbi:MAG TPA: helix-turn-helix transcriptional regulator [Geobacteraceae bacterium]
MRDLIGKRLKQLRLERGLTQKELAAGVSGGLDYTYVGKIERGEQFPSLKILEKIGEALSVSLAYFFRDEAAAAVHDISPAELKRLAKDAQGRELLGALKLLHEDDIPLVTEIVRVLTRHRSAAMRKRSGGGEEEALMAAEDGASYSEK